MFGNKEKILLLNNENYREFFLESYSDKDEKKRKKLKKKVRNK